MLFFRDVVSYLRKRVIYPECLFRQTPCVLVVPSGCTMLTSPFDVVFPYPGPFVAPGVSGTANHAQ